MRLKVPPPLAYLVKLVLVDLVVEQACPLEIDPVLPCQLLDDLRRVEQPVAVDVLPGGTVSRGTRVVKIGEVLGDATAHGVDIDDLLGTEPFRRIAHPLGHIPRCKHRAPTIRPPSHAIALAAERPSF